VPVCGVLQYVLNPTFLPEQISQMETTSRLSRAYDGSTYLPGTALLLTVTELITHQRLLSVLDLAWKVLENSQQRSHRSSKGLEFVVVIFKVLNVLENR